jgi:hypothetical protein
VIEIEFCGKYLIVALPFFPTMQNFGFAKTALFLLWFTRPCFKNENLTRDMKNFHGPFMAWARDCSLNHSTTLNKAFDHLIGPFTE